MNNIQLQHGNLLQAPAEVLVNTVNCVGVMGKGIALQFERAFPEISRPYKEACEAGHLHPGELFVVELQPTLEKPLPLSIVNFATKNHWRGTSKIQWIRAGLSALVEMAQERGWRSIAIPPLGCGNGGLHWSEVRPLIQSTFETLPEIQIFLFPPEGAPDAATMTASAKAPNMTKASALYIQLLANYSVIDLEFSQLEFQKLAYFLQEAGEPHLNLHFETKPYGPASREIYPMIRRWEKHWTIGFGDGTSGVLEPIMIRPEIVEAANNFLQKNPAPESEARMMRVLELIKGMDTAMGLELLATVHWVAKNDSTAADHWEIAAEAVQKWNKRKKQVFKRDWIEAAWNRLHDFGWIHNQFSTIA